MITALFILDEKADIKDTIRVYKEFRKYMGYKYRTTQGITVLANDEAIKGNELELAIQANIKFLPNWQENPMYRDMLREALKSSNIFVMRKKGYV